MIKSLCLASFLRLKINKHNTIVTSSTTEIAKIAGCNRKTIEAPFRELTESGLISTESVLDGKGDLVQALCFNEEKFAAISEAIPVEGASCHDAVIDDLVSSMFQDLSIENRLAKLSPVNTLLLCSILSAADQNGITNSLSQNKLKKLFGFSTARLKSQLRKLQHLGLLEVLSVGGAEKGKGRKISTLKLDVKKIRNAYEHAQKQTSYILIMDDLNITEAVTSANERGQSFLRISNEETKDLFAAKGMRDLSLPWQSNQITDEIEALLDSVNELLSSQFEHWKYAPPEGAPPHQSLKNDLLTDRLVYSIAKSVFSGIASSKWGTSVKFASVRHDDKRQSLIVRLEP
ncbi:hypothetical protein FM042_09280 [Aliidiomarina halalkaliphila]|uniref:Uncharacterized protein n=1 Tax=Aliidiomarina halalkaliphila TaxID=2593535 RepID=A0A552WZX2_9GAMM|nr:hypothetical protein [Aliidiomarina halalkaliphila]TRW48362.1 hypothetical protein FM042_09280 [Aliidiomarina halalkaliphila]